ncbi:phage tail tape measure protein [Collimonas humicola]|uniref:phage tail tape measure protein n=1 Tax=Collimonas humicola TaxID=2825886 RepID=UPI001B8D6374|nr:phage tail protein [Collimonas humicola]
MSDKQLRLQVVFAALDKLTGPLKKITGESSALGRAIKANNDRLKELNAQQKDVGRFRELNAGLQASSGKLRETQQQIAALAQRMQQTTTPTRAMTREWNAAVKSAGALKQAGQQQGEQMQILRTRLSGAGIDTRQLGAAQTWLKNSIAFTNAELTAQQKKLAAVGAQQQKVAGARQHADRLRTNAGNVAAAGIGATVAGGAVGAPLVTGLKEAKHYQTEKGRITALGLGPKVSTDAESYARNMQTYGTSHAENLELVRDSMSVFGDLPHAQMVAPMLAKMKFANKAFYGEEAGGENERKFMDMLKVIEVRGGTASAEKFNEQANMVQKVISATGGRVGPTEWLNLIKTGGIAAKGMDEKSFYYELEPLVQELGGFGVGNGLMSSYNNLYQGRTSKRAAMNLDKLGLIGDHTKVKHDKVGQTAQLDPGALLGADLFKKSQFEWMEKILLPQLAKHGITSKDKILDTIGSLFTNRKAGDLMANMYLQRAQIHKNRTLNEGAYNVDQLEPLAREQAAGKEMAARAKLADLQLTMGEKILPLYSSAIETVTKALEGLNGFMERNPATAKAMIVGFGILAAILVVLGPLMLGLAALIGPYAMLHVLFAKMGVAGGVLTPILRGISGGFMTIGKTVLWLGRVLLTNPIVLLITLIAVLAYLIYKNWEPLKVFFSDLWDGITERFSRVWETIKTFAGGLWADVKTAFDGGIGGVSALIMNWSPLGLFYKAFAGVMSWFGVELPGTFTEFGANIIQGLVNGISSGFSFLKDKIKQLGAMVGMTFAKEQEIHSPSRVFSRFGGFITEGLALGIENGQDAPINQVSGLAKRLTQLGAGIAIGATAMPALSFDTRPPIAPRAAGAGTVIQGDTITISIAAAPGMDEQAIARAVMLAMEQRDREKAARTRSSLSDNHF